MEILEFLECCDLNGQEDTETCLTKFTWNFWINLLLVWMSITDHQLVFQIYSGDIVDLSFWGSLGMPRHTWPLLIDFFASIDVYLYIKNQFHTSNHSRDIGISKTVILDIYGCKKLISSINSFWRYWTF